MIDIILKAENISKQYRLGTVGTGTLSHDLNRLWHKIRGKEDPYLKIGAINDRSAIANSEYVWALKNIHFEVKRGEILGIIGKNGAGKSTLLKILSRVTSPTTGTIKTKGRIASLLEVGTGMHPELTGRENVYLNGAILGMTKTEIALKIDDIVAFSGCQMYIDTPVKRYSSGMRVRLGFAVAAFLEPDILVVDEVLAVGDAEFQKKAIGKMQDISNTGGRTVLFVSHNMAAVRRLCTRAIVLQNGETSYEGDTSDAIDFYTKNIDLGIIKTAMVTDEHRRSSTSSLTELTKISIINEEVTTREELRLKIEFLNNDKNLSKAQFSGSLCGLNEDRLGSFFIDFKNVKEGQNSYNIIIHNHNLVQGIYTLNVGLGKGEFGVTEIKPIDHAYEVLRFEIEKEFPKDEKTIRWNSVWGKANYKAEILSE